MLLITFFTVFVSCEGCESSSNKEDADSDNTVVETEDQSSFYLIPSPEDLFEFTDDPKLIFTPTLLNGSDNVEKYIDNKSKEINFGIYAADLAYCAAFSKNQETVEYLHVVRNLGDKIGITAAFDESFAKRSESIDDNRDSLKKISSDTYFDIVRFLEQNKKTSTLCLISVGGWLESLYLVTNLVDKYDEKNITIQRIAEQRVVFANLILYLQQNDNIESVKNILKQIEPIQQVYESLQVVTEEEKSPTEKKDKIVVGGKTKIMMNEQEFKKLRETIARVRNNIVQNNVTL